MCLVQWHDKTFGAEFKLKTLLCSVSIIFKREVMYKKEKK